MSRPLGSGAGQGGAERRSHGRVLIADDSAVVRMVVAKQLVENGWEVSEARDGNEAIEACRRRPPDVLLLDIEMPRVDGFAVLAQLQADPELAEIPVVFLTKFTSAEDVAEGLRAGADDYLRKPFETPELVARLLVALRTRRLRDELRARNVELERLATTDVLTDLPNRRSIQLALAAAVSRSKRHPVPLAVVLIDIDLFKQVNDRHGHAVGDEVLQEVARRVRARLRLEDTCGRWGGEEFLVLAPDTTGEAATVLAEAVRALIADAPMTAAQLPVTVSLGVAEYADGDDPEALIRRADEALYEAKAAGRNTVR